MWYSPSYGLITAPKAITKDGIQHPANIFTAWPKGELANIGFHPARMDVLDYRYYNSGASAYTFDDLTQEWVISYSVASEKKLDDLKNSMKDEVKGLASSRLSGSDWMRIREGDGGTAMSEVWKTYRTDVRSTSNTKDSEIDALSNLDAVKDYQNSSVVEVRYVRHSETDPDTGVITETIGPDTESFSRSINKVDFGWPTAPDAIPDPYHVRYE